MPETRTTSSTGGQKGTKLARFDLIPAGPLTELAEHYGRGARKYANHQWRQGYEWSKSIAALGRHYALFMQGYDYDVCSNDPDGCAFIDASGEPYEPTEPDTCFNHTGSHHMAAVAWHAFLLLEFKDTHPQHDDRYRPDSEPWVPEVDWAEALAERSPFKLVTIDPVVGTSSGLESGVGDLTELERGPDSFVPYVDEIQVWTADFPLSPDLWTLLTGLPWPGREFSVGGDGVTESIGRPISDFINDSFNPQA